MFWGLERPGSFWVLAFAGLQRAAPRSLALTTCSPQFQEEADSISQTLAKINSNLNTQYSSAPGGPPGPPTELLRQLEVSS